MTQFWFLKIQHLSGGQYIQATTPATQPWDQVTATDTHSGPWFFSLTMTMTAKAYWAFVDIKHQAEQQLSRCTATSQLLRIRLYRHFPLMEKMCCWRYFKKLLNWKSHLCFGVQEAWAPTHHLLQYWFVAATMVPSPLDSRASLPQYARLLTEDCSRKLLCLGLTASHNCWASFLTSFDVTCTPLSPKMMLSYPRKKNCSFSCCFKSICRQWLWNHGRLWGLHAFQSPNSEEL